ncbi:hypothetical protein QWZ04_10370 [Vibrio tapetis subsp. quintayensis]|uniref:hypothetical protein n=1 Tax=Vibrio tapetis TaxID=52443 RepID=UPI0025B588CC|nr:hypothetical protein [Vibrio tapetis]MDN3680724.1 hypothetical protein [Vibrio tapetis subsp. quintayensis]
MFGRARAVALLGLAALSPFAANANNFNYTSLEVRIGANPSTYGAEGKMAFTENTHFIGRFDSNFESDYDLAGGIGFNGPATQFADIYGHILLHNIKDSSDKFVGSDFIPELAFGMRAWVIDRIEANVMIGQLVYSDGSETIYSIGGRFHSTDQLSIGANLADHGVYGPQLLLGARFMF